MADAGKTKSHLEEHWERASGHLRRLLNAETFESWINPIVPVSLDGDVLTLGVSDTFFISWLQDNFGELITNSISSVVKRPVSVKYEPGYLLAENEKEPGQAPEPTAPVQMLKARNCHSRHTFKNFVVGPENEFAASAAMGVAKKSLSSPNPLFIYGSTGLGKTHLLQAVAHKVSIKDHSAVEYVTCEEFVNLFYDCLKENRMSKFRTRFRKADFLMIDDIHFLSGKPQLQAEFFNTFNKLYNEDKRIILTSDRRPSEIVDIEDRIVSRFDSGLTVDIQPLGVETRLAVLRKKQEEHLTKLDDDVLLFVATNINSHVRKLEGALTRLLTYHSLRGGSITVADAEEILRPMLEESAVMVSIDSIQKRVADYFDLKVADLTGIKRPRNIAAPRMLAMYLCRKMTDKSLPEIGSSFARNHATVLHAVKEVEKRRAAEDSFRHTVSLIERQLKS